MELLYCHWRNNGLARTRNLVTIFSGLAFALDIDYIGPFHLISERGVEDVF